MAFKKIYTSPGGNTVYKDSEMNEYRVAPKGVPPRGSDGNGKNIAFTDDKQDAIDTANYMDKHPVKAATMKKPTVKNSGALEYLRLRTGLAKPAIEKFAQDNKVDIDHLAILVEKDKLDPQDVVTSIVGKPGNRIQKKVQKFLSEQKSPDKPKPATTVTDYFTGSQDEDDWWATLSKKQQLDYLKSHPDSKLKPKALSSMNTKVQESAKLRLEIAAGKPGDALKKRSSQKQKQIDSMKEQRKALVKKRGAAKTKEQKNSIQKQIDSLDNRISQTKTSMNLDRATDKGEAKRLRSIIKKRK